MDHRWDASTWADRASRAEGERYGTSRIERDPDVERRDRLREEERRRTFNQSPWAIGALYYDQRDLYTRNASIADDGYGVGPRYHPEEGSYAYPRGLEASLMASLPERDSKVHERQAWPWLNYKRPSGEPCLERLHEARPPSLWQRMKARLRRALVPPKRGPFDGRIQRDVELALAFRRDLDASNIRVSVRGGEVTLEGTVVDRRSKRVAAETAEGVSLVRAVRNRLAIRPDDPAEGEMALLRPLAWMRACT